MTEDFHELIPSHNFLIFIIIYIMLNKGFIKLIKTGNLKCFSNC